jgi:Raf kinase inhibitor-like YbhB/YbcL family protein
MFARNGLIAMTLGGWLLGGCSHDAQSANGPQQQLKVTSTAFSTGQTIPQKYTCSGADVSPPLTWGLSRAGTKSIAVIADDTDAPGGTFTHWMLFNLPADTDELTENIPRMPTLPSGAKQGVNDFGKTGYSGPCPPSGQPHHYHFKVYALDRQLNLTPDAKSKDLTAAMNHHIVAEGELTGVFGR